MAVRALVAPTFFARSDLDMLPPTGAAPAAPPARQLAPCASSSRVGDHARPSEASKPPQTETTARKLTAAKSEARKARLAQPPKVVASSPQGRARGSSRKRGRATPATSTLEEEDGIAPTIPAPWPVNAAEASTDAVRARMMSLPDGSDLGRREASEPVTISSVSSVMPTAKGDHL